jgi:uncharacterized membrane protein
MGEPESSPSRRVIMTLIRLNIFLAGLLTGAIIVVGVAILAY